MLIYDFYTIGNKLFTLRKEMGLTQAEVAEKANISDRTYADIERGSVNMRVETMLRICEALRITPNDILTEEKHAICVNQEELLNKLNERSTKERETALRLLSAYLSSVE